jgi:hypothetical protein
VIAVRGPRGITQLFNFGGAGLTSETAVLCIVLGLVFGVFPVPWGPTLLCFLAAGFLRLNPAALQAVNYIAYPLQIALFVPFIRIGAWLFRSAPTLAAGAGFWPGHAVLSVCLGAVHASVAWFCLCVPSGLLLYGCLTIALRRWTRFPARPTWCRFCGNCCGCSTP